MNTLFIDKLGRNAGREIWKDSAKFAAEYIYYRKVGDHATNMPSSVYFGKKKGDILSITESVKYKYDTMGNICRIDENGEPVVWYKYDALNRLVREDNKTFKKTWLYSYDNKGNILCKRTTNFTLKENVEECEFTSVQYEYDGDKLLTYGTQMCEYDAIGNPETYRGKSVGWSNGRQMTSYDGTVFTYDGLGRRLSKGDINYTYDSNNRIIKQSNGIEFLYDNSGVAGIVYNSGTYLYRKDGQGNIVALIDSNGNVVVEYKYDAWGNQEIEISDTTYENLAKANPFRYRGYYYDEETGLYYLKSRYYDPETGRFITIDDISYLDPETINGLNLYAYCGNNPVMNVDPYGNSELSTSTYIDIFAFLFQTTVSGTLLFLERLVKTSVRPNNIGIGKYAKIQKSYISQFSKVSRVLGKISTAVAILTVVLSVAEGINTDIARGYTADRIVSNAFTNLVVYGGITIAAGLIGSSIGAALGSVLPGVGTIIGAVIGFVVGTVAGFVLEIEIGGKSIIDHIRDGVYNFWQWLFG